MAKKLKLIEGQKLEKCTFIKGLTYTNNGKSMGVFLCKCGIVFECSLSNAISGKVYSCGCKRNPKKHGNTTILDGKRVVTSEYNSWRSMKKRCYLYSNPSYKDYGNRGIKICDRWLNSFENFLADMGKKPTAKHSIDRIDVNGNYEPSNCRWTTIDQQNRNKTSNVFLEFEGLVLCMTDWANKVGIKTITLNSRLKHGWSIEKALTLPIRKSTQ